MTQDPFRLTKKLHGKPANLFHSQSEKTQNRGSTLLSQKEQVLLPETLTQISTALAKVVKL